MTHKSFLFYFTDTSWKLRKKLYLNHRDGKSYPLINLHGKCLAVETAGTKSPADNGAKIIQAECNPSEEGQLWKYDQEKQILCNNWSKCLSLPLDNNQQRSNSDVFHWDLIEGENRQKWTAWNTGQFNNNGSWCLAFEGNSNSHGVRAKTGNCNDLEDGQLWSFARYFLYFVLISKSLLLSY